MATCFLHEVAIEVPDVEILDHLRVMHPDVWGKGPMRWSDGRLVVFDETLTPGDFARPAAPPQARDGCPFCMTGLEQYCPWHHG